ncbi:MAG: NfeD family protein [Candidatus Methanoplasma sp.]|jgi:membrane protein implicated in regulation of membrane protease activity|nr:NfeD family protein [Candidatus Methanoplasma sp.]
MDPITIAIILMILGLVLLIIEALTPGFFAVVPGAVLVVMGLLIYFVDGILDKWYLLVLAAIVVTFVVTAITFKGYQILAKPEPPTTTVASSLIGREGLVVTDVKPGNLKGKVKIGSDSWSATSEDLIVAGTEVVVYDAEGVHVKVRQKNS